MLAASLARCVAAPCRSVGGEVRLWGVTQDGNQEQPDHVPRDADVQSDTGTASADTASDMDSNMVRRVFDVKTLPRTRIDVVEV